MSQLAIVVPAPVRAVLSRFGDVGRVRPTVGGYSNTTFFTTIDGEAVVVKANSDIRKRADLRRETEFLRFLATTDLPVPALRGYGADDDDEWTVLVIGAIDAESGMSLIQRSDVDELELCARQLGRMFSVVHDTTLGPFAVPAGLEIDLSARWATDRAVDLAANVAFTHPALKTGLSLVHGDAGFHNTLWDDGQLVGLIDWEFAGQGNPLADAAWIWWSLTFRRAPDGVWDSFVDGYRSDRLAMLGWSSDAVLALVRAQMFSLLARTREGSGAQKEWRRRLDALGQLQVPELS